MKTIKAKLATKANALCPNHNQARGLKAMVSMKANALCPNHNQSR